MNKEIIEDLIKNNPDLDKKKLEEVIILLRQNNPDIRIEKKFKQNLKSRLDSIIEFKQEIKKGFFGRLFLVPVFSIFLIIGGIFYLYKDINLLNNNDFEYRNIEIIGNIENIEKKGEKIINSENMNSPIIPFHKGDEDKIEKDNIEVEDNQIMEILGESSDDYSSDNSKMIIPDAPNRTIEETMFYDDGNNEPYINTFIDYCEEYNSEILIDENSKKFCIIEEKTCMESNYSENTCKLIEKK